MEVVAGIGSASRVRRTVQAWCGMQCVEGTECEYMAPGKDMTNTRKQVEAKQIVAWCTDG